MVYKFNSNVKLILTEDGAYLEKEGETEKYTVGGAGVEFVKLIDGVRDLDQILEELLNIYGPNVEPYVLAMDLERFVGNLIDSNLITLVKSKYSYS